MPMAFCVLISEEAKFFRVFFTVGPVLSVGQAGLIASHL